ncbi:MAG: threonylcarbamoyl-AMP synthase [Candidatus Cloacimonetes bacterium]|nr:threonylcarbamoyl-AMP synthase [Candidatus Cloacimonadota bacterium]
MLLVIHPEKPQERLIQRVVDVLNKGGIIVYPTDTSYGMGCSIYSKKAIEKIYQIRQFDKNKQLSIVCSNLSDASKYANMSGLAYKSMKRLLPGPYTMIMPATKLVPKRLHSKRKEVGIRIPDNAICQAIVSELGHPLLSAGTRIEEVEYTADIPHFIHEEYGNMVDIVIDGGCLQDAYSTMIQFDGDYAEVVRKGLGNVDFI